MGVFIGRYAKECREYFLAHGVDDAALRRIVRAGTAVQYDKEIWVSRRGMKDIREYYHWADVRPRLSNARIPILVLCALDDPVVGSHMGLASATRDNPLVEHIALTYGGHLGTTLRSGRDLASQLVRIWAAGTGERAIVLE